jgi:glycosyltransferase involved in cell wall biosynthesis
VRLAVDAYGLTRPLAGMGTYTREILAALREARPEAEITLVEQPSLRFAGRHLLLARRVRSLRPDALFAPAGHLPLLGTGVPEVVTVHDLAIYRHPEWFPRGQPLATRVVVPRSLRRARRLIAVSTSTARDASELFGIDPARITVVHHGVSPRFQPPARAPAAGYVLFVGTLEPRKNLETLLAAWAGVRTQVPLVIAGLWGWRHEEIRRRLERLGGRVRLVGATAPEALPALYAGAACLAHPAWYEGFGMTILEAMASGAPVACSNTSSLPEVAGDAALLLDPGDVDAWRETLQRLLDDAALRAELRARGLRRAAGFTWTRAARETWAVLELAAGAGAAS